jgi:competence protein ComFC
MAYPHRFMKNIWEFAVDLVFPYRCVICERYLDKTHLCEKCFKSLPIKKQFECIGCKRPTLLGKTCTFCREENTLDQLFIVSDFKNSDVASVIRLFKYRFLPDLAEPLARLTSKYLDHIAQRDHFSFIQTNSLLVPVPLHQTREYWRGFNQAELIARHVGRRYRLDVDVVLTRTARGIPQAELEDRPERLSNVEGLYTCFSPENIKGRSVLLVDDVCTTGATLNECARVLKEAGAGHVAALVVARG